MRLLDGAGIFAVKSLKSNGIQRSLARRALAFPGRSGGRASASGRAATGGACPRRLLGLRLRLRTKKGPHKATLQKWSVKRTKLVAVLLDARGAQAGKAMIGNRTLPGEEFFDGQRVTITRFFEAQQATPHRCDDFCLPSDDPTPGICGRQISDGKWTAIGADDIFNAWTNCFGHLDSLHKQRPYPATIIRHI
jgi:hypothetical protein